ncbi:RDD family protein [Pontibacter ummariensis]|uniref:RDD family protein n=1 Tax=Pontibacter ummariensis TaxID=1610492 RepID=A0A239BGQ2_9BACT|nr:RDD family protein [Pontibacter ummariensis]PRY16539.1 RDD family protein [Pontibacter ummariensis]SNS06966.1 RDD family protein [Pontibacter ummariensis]
MQEATYTQTQVKREAVLASMEARLAAFALDMLLILILIGVVDFLTFSSDEEALLLKPERLLYLLLGWLYFAGAESCSCQATLGKYLMNLRVTHTTGERLGFKVTSTRYVARPVSALMMLMRFLTGTSGNVNRWFHDRVTNSQVTIR